MKRSSELWLSGLIVLLAVPVHLIGLLSPGIYRDPAILLPQNLGTDVITLGVGLPLLAATAIGTWRGSLAARLLWLGALGFLTYAYGMYAVGVRWNPLFLAYLALFGLSLYGLILGLVGTDATRVRARFTRRPPVRAVAGYLIAVSILVSGVWLAEEVRAVVTRSIPPSVLQFEAPTNIVHVFDLGIVFPAMVIAAVQLLRDRPWGYVLSGMLLVKAATIGLWVVVMIWFSTQEGFAAGAAYSSLFLGLTVAACILVWRFLAPLVRTGGGDAASVYG